MLDILLSFNLSLLYRHGLSKSGIEGSRPLPEKADEPSPYSVLQNYFIKPTSFYDIPFDSADDDDDDKLTLSDASSLGTGRSLTSIESFQSVRTLGNTTATGRSSVYSWGSEDVSKSPLLPFF